MLKALQLIFEPARTWDAIARAERGVLAVFSISLLPTLLIASWIEGWGLKALGNQPTSLDFAGQQTVPVALETILRYELVQGMLNLAIVFLLAFFFRLVFRSFACRATFAQSFSLIAYSYGPLLLMQAVDGIPAASTWICRIVGIALAIKVFYIGLGRIARPEPATALGLYFIGSLLLIVLGGLGHFLSVQVLEAGLLNQFRLPGFGN